MRWKEWLLSLSPERRKKIAEEQKLAMFKHGWAHPDRSVDEYHEAIDSWQQQYMNKNRDQP